MTEEEIIIKVWEVFQQLFGGSGNRLFLIGSRASGTHRPYSDFDFAIVGPQAVEWNLLREFRSRVHALSTLHGIDIVDFQTTDENFKSVAGKAMREIEHGKVGPVKIYPAI